MCFICYKYYTAVLCYDRTKLNIYAYNVKIELCLNHILLMSDMRWTFTVRYDNLYHIGIFHRLNIYSTELINIINIR